MSQALKNKFHRNVSKVKAGLTVVDTIKEDEHNQKHQFIKKYGVQIEMPAHYIFQTFYYKNDTNYIINACSQVFPEDNQYYDFDRINPNGDNPESTEFHDENVHLSNRIIFKVYMKENQKFQELSHRICDSIYYQKLCFAQNKTALALIRKVSNSNEEEVNNIFKSSHYVVDIFDCSKIDFFLNKEPLTPNDPSLMFTIEDETLKDIKSLPQLEKIRMRFAGKRSFFVIQTARDTIIIYDLMQKERLITEPIVYEKLPPQYESIINIGVDKQDISNSKIAAKRTDFRNIDIFSLAYLQDINRNNQQREGRVSLTWQQIISIQKNYDFSTIRLTDFDLESSSLIFSEDHSTVIFCDKSQNILVELTKGEQKQHQKNIHHIEGKTCRLISKYGVNDFLIATAHKQDSDISIYLASDPSKKLKFYLRFQEGSVKIQDILEDGNEIKTIITRDDEEFVLYSFEDFHKETFWQRFYTSSNYIFEWPYIVYINGKDTVLVQNAFDPSTTVFIRMKIDDGESISHIYLNEAYYLYIVISTPTEYLIYEKDLDKMMPLIMKKHKEEQNLEVQDGGMKVKFLGNVIKKIDDTPIARITKELLNYKSLYKIFVRPSSAKEFIQSNHERMIFFICDFKIYQINAGCNNFQYIDRGYKFKTINPSLVAFNCVTDKGKRSNSIKFLKMGYGDKVVFDVYKEHDGKVVEFMTQENQLMILTKPANTVHHLLKIFHIVNEKSLKLESEIIINDPEFIANLTTVEAIANNMIPCGNSLYHIVKFSGQVRIHKYTNVLPLHANSGDQVLFTSPLVNKTYRKMVYFVSNKKFQKTKQAYIIPYVNDNFILFNKRENLTQYCQMYEYRNLATMQNELELINIVPYTQQVQHYTTNGQLVSIFKLKKIYQEYGEHNLAISPNGHYFLQHSDNDVELKEVNIIMITLSSVDNYQGKQRSGTLAALSKILPPKLAQSSSIHTSSFVDIQFIETLKLDEISINDELYTKLGKHTLSQVVKYYIQQGCDVQAKINDNLDLLIGFSHNKKGPNKKDIKTVKELFLVKKNVDGSRTSVKVRPILNELPKMKLENLQKDSDPLNQRSITVKLLEEYTQGAATDDNQDFAYFLAMQELHNTIDFLITNEKIVVWSNDTIFSNDITEINYNSNQLSLIKAKFQIENIEESHISLVSARGHNEEDKKMGNYYIYIKIIYDSTQAFFMKYNINKNKEFSSFDCSIDALAFYDTKQEGYILDTDSIIDIDQGVPLYYYQTGMNQINKQYLMGGNLDCGPRFCPNNVYFTVRNKLYLPYSFLALVVIEENQNKFLEADLYDPTLFFCINGDTNLHQAANNFKNLEFQLNEFERANPKLINMILLQNKEGKNVLGLAIQHNNTRNVNLILDKLGKISMNNIHAVKNYFPELIDYNGFEDYLKLCFFQTDQMKNKKVFQRKPDETENYSIIPHDTSFFDKQFYQKCHDPSQDLKPVDIRALDAGWLLKYSEGPGPDFLQKLSNCENMAFFEIDTVKLLVNYQWKIIKPLIIKKLFIPFLVNMLLFNVYCLYLFEKEVGQDQTTMSSILTNVVQGILLLFTVWTFYVEYQQMMFHQNEYFKSIWNLLDLTVVVMTPLIVILALVLTDVQIIRPLMAFNNLIFYVRFFYFLRIFDDSAPLVRTIIEITYDIRHFLFVFFLGIIGFGASFFILSNNADTTDEKQEPFIQSFFKSIIYSYRLSLGDFDTDSFVGFNGEFLLWTLFIICSMFTAIILLNMLVAIMGESFNRVNAQQESNRVREHLQLIVENDFLISRKECFGDVKYLIEIKDDVIESQNDPVNVKLDDINTKISKDERIRNDQFQELRDILKQLGSVMNYQQNEVQAIKEMLQRQQDDSFTQQQTTTEH